MMFGSGMKESQISSALPIDSITPSNSNNKNNTPPSASDSNGTGIKNNALVEIVIEDVRLPVFKCLLEYCYCGDVELNPKFIVELFKASNQYRLGELKVKSYSSRYLSIIASSLQYLSIISMVPIMDCYSYDPNEMRDHIVLLV